MNTDINCYWFPLVPEARLFEVRISKHLRYVEDLSKMLKSSAYSILDGDEQWIYKQSHNELKLVKNSYSLKFLLSSNLRSFLSFNPKWMHLNSAIQCLSLAKSFFSFSESFNSSDRYTFSIGWIWKSDQLWVFPKCCTHEQDFLTNFTSDL